MKIIRHLVFSLAILSTGHALAATGNDKAAHTIVKDIKALQKAGVALHKKYDFSQLQDVKACVSQNGYLRDKGKILKGKAREYSDMNRYIGLSLVPAADAAFVCVFCGKIGTECADALEELKEVELKLKPNRTEPSATSDRW